MKKAKKLSEMLERGMDLYGACSGSWDDKDNTQGCGVGTIVLYASQGAGGNPNNVADNVRELFNLPFKGTTENFNKPCVGSASFGHNTVGRFINYLYEKRKFSRHEIVNILKKFKF